MRLRLLGLVLLLGLTACDVPPDDDRTAVVACTAGSIAGQGSSAQANALGAWIKDYQVACPAAAIRYASVGSGAGVRDFVAGKGGFAGTDSPLDGAGRAAATTRCAGPALHLPLVVGPIALAYNVAGVDELRLSPRTIARLFTGTVRRWDDATIAADNPGVALPATPVRPVHRSDSSGTTENFGRFLAATAPGDWPFAAGPRWPAPGGLGVRGSNRLVSTVERTDGAIGYVEASYARFHHLPTAHVGNAGGAFVPLADDAAARTVAAARVTGTGGDLRLALDHAVADPAAYPLVLVSYEIVCRQGSPALVKSFLAYAASEAGQQAVAGLGYAPLPERLRAEVAAAVQTL